MHCDVTTVMSMSSSMLTRARPPAFTHLTLAVCRYSTPTTSNSTQKNQPLNNLPTSPIKKPKIDLRPAPIKPKTTLTSSHPPIKPTRPASSVLNSTPKFGSAKEEVVRDISDAEQHGILTPPPVDANWFKRTLHQAIELFVRSFYLIGRYNSHLSVEILLSWCEAHIQSPETYCLDQSTYQIRRCPFDKI
jgi:hypothetical protein